VNEKRGKNRIKVGDDAPLFKLESFNADLIDLKELGEFVIDEQSKKIYKRKGWLLLLEIFKVL